MALISIAAGDDFAQTNDCPAVLVRRAECPLRLGYVYANPDRAPPRITLRSPAGGAGNSTGSTLSWLGLWPAPPPADRHTHPDSDRNTYPNTHSDPDADRYLNTRISLSGIAVQGPMLLSSVTAYAVNGNGSNGSVLGSAVTDSSGKFGIQLMVPQPGPVRVTASGGSFVSEMDGSTVSSPASISALLADAAPPCRESRSIR